MLLCGCAAYAPGELAPGATEAAVRARMGEPTGVIARAAGARSLEYARGHFGRHTWRIDLDAAGRVTAMRQLLDEAAFEAVAAGEPREAVRERLGRPAEVRGGWRGIGEVWSYRYDAPPPYCRWFQVWLVEGRVREAAYAPDPLCEERRRERRDEE